MRTTTTTNGHANNANGVLSLARERAALHDDELELTYGPNGVIIAHIPHEADFETPGEPIAVRVSLHPFLAGMNPHHLMLLTECASPTHFRKGETILNEGDHADYFYLLESGKVVIEAIADAQKHVLVETIGAGELLGWSWMFPPYTWHFTARAVEATDTLVLSGPELREYCEKVHSLGYELFKRMSAVMTHRLQAARLKMLTAHERPCAGGCRHH
jgi:CRP-like cAMP-binding protein